jgi:uncharacterized protein (DUF952 family)
MTILHSCPHPAWRQAQAEGRYTGDTLDTDHAFPPGRDGSFTVPVTVGRR